MKKNGFDEAQVIGAAQEQEVVSQTAELRRGLETDAMPREARDPLKRRASVALVRPPPEGRKSFPLRNTDRNARFRGSEKMLSTPRSDGGRF